MRPRHASHPLLIALALALALAPAVAAAAPAPSRERIAGPMLSVCGTRPGAAADLVRARLARPASVPLPTSHSVDVDGIAVLEDDGSFFFPDKNGDVHVDLASVTNAFYRTHGDDYDVLAVYLASGLNDYFGSPFALASEFGVRNGIQGIGLDLFDFGADFGSAARLQAVLSMNGLDRYPVDPDSNLLDGDLTPLDILAHELGHRWLAYVFVDSAGSPSPALLGRDQQHWNFFFDSDASVMDGCDWTPVAADSFRTDSITTGYGRLDLYLMGLMPKAEIDSFLVVNDPGGFDPPGDYVPGSPPLSDLGCRGRATWWRMDDLEAVNGPRVPDAAAAPHAFRMAFILVTANGAAPVAADLGKLGTLRARFPGAFLYATRGRGNMDCTLDSRAGRVRIAHTPLLDTEDALAPRPIGCRVSIAGGGLPIGVDGSSVAALWRPVGSPGWSAIPLAAAGTDSFAGALPPLPGGGAAEYYLFAASDSAGISADEPPAAASAPFVYHVGPDVTPPAIAHVPMLDQGEARMPQTLLARITDNLGVDSAWVEYALDGGPPQIAGATRAGQDTFAVSLGGGLLQGQRIAYRIVARDAAAAHNLAASGADWDTLRVGRDWVDDFENGDAGYTHQALWYSYRDAWHLTQEQSSPPGGTAWKCGAWDADGYPPHLDSYLVTPVLADIVPGTLLVFDHRYDLEQADATNAWDGARLEARVGSGDWQVLTPSLPYSHVYRHGSNPFQSGTPCWSGSSGGWRTEVVDLGPLAPGPARIRFRMLADDFAGLGGWFVDRVRVQYPGTAGVPGASGPWSVGRPWPNPARAELRLSGSLARAAEGDWSLYDVAGRRVAALWSGVMPAGPFEIRGSLRAVRAGLYFARLRLGGREAGTTRIAVVR